MNSSFCPVTNLWLDTEKARTAHIGASLYRQWRIFKSHPRLRYSLPVFLFTFFFLILLGFTYELGLQYAFLDGPSIRAFLTATALASLLLVVPLGIRSSLKRRKNFLNRLLFMDGLFSILILVFIGVYLHQHRWHIGWALNSSEWVEAVALSLVYAAWLLSRVLESAILRKKLMVFALTDKMSHQLLNNLRPVSQKILGSEKRALFTVLIVLIPSLPVFYFLGYPPENLVFILALALPASLSFYQLSASILVAQAAKNRVLLPNLQSLHELSLFKHLRIHHRGVITETKSQLVGHWIDPSSEFSEPSTFGLVKGLAQHFEHPVSQAISSSLEAETQDIPLSEITSHPYRGLEYLTRKTNGDPMRVFFGNWNWTRLNKHDTSPELLRKIAEWKEADLSISVLSINERVVAAFAVEDCTREDAESFLKEQRSLGKKICLISSNQKLPAPAVQAELTEFKTNLLSIERDLQLKKWEERADKFLELNAFWDPRPKDAAYIRFCKDGCTPSKAKEIQIFSPRLQAASWLFQVAAAWKRSMKRNSVFSLVLSLVLLGVLALSGFDPRGLLVVLCFFSIVSLLRLKRVEII